MSVTRFPFLSLKSYSDSYRKGEQGAGQVNEGSDRSHNCERYEERASKAHPLQKKSKGWATRAERSVVDAPP